MSFRASALRLRAVLLLMAPIMWCAPHAALAAPPAAKPQRARLDPLEYYEALRKSIAGIRQPEIVEMLVALAHGSDMGPGEGWFHDGQSRFGWKWLAGRFDANKDGTITRAEFKGPTELFDRLDRNHDGVLTASDFDWSSRSLYSMQGMPAGYWFSMVDGDSNGRITREEWLAYFKKMARGKDYLTPDDLREAFPLSRPPQPPGPKPKNQGPSPLTLVVGLMTGELGSLFEGPAIGQPAPDFHLKTQDGSRQIKLSTYLGKKPVVLVFGSFT